MAGLSLCLSALCFRMREEKAAGIEEEHVFLLLLFSIFLNLGSSSGGIGK